MGAYSTLHITRTTARHALLEKVMEADDETLGDMLDVILRERLYNAIVVNDDQDNSDSVLDRGW